MSIVGEATGLNGLQLHGGVDYNEPIAKRRKMPRQKPSESKQDYATPPEFIAALERRFGAIHVDLAASEENKRALFCYTEQDDALSRPRGEWAERIDSGNAFLNPPFGNIPKFVERCALEATHLVGGARILVLVPASFGAVWWQRFVHPCAYALGLLGRMTFVGEIHPFPKDLALLIYTAVPMPGYSHWRWK